MALNFHPLMLTILALLLVSLSSKSNVSAACIPGGFCPRNPNDPTIIKIGNFSVMAYNRMSKTKLVFESVVEAQSQVVAGANYRLVIKEKNDSIASFPHVYEAYVFAGLHGPNDLHLRYFSKLVRAKV